MHTLSYIPMINLFYKKFSLWWTHPRPLLLPIRQWGSSKCFQMSPPILPPITPPQNPGTLKHLSEQAHRHKKSITLMSFWVSSVLSAPTSNPILPMEKIPNQSRIDIFHHGNCWRRTHCTRRKKYKKTMRTKTRKLTIVPCLLLMFTKNISWQKVWRHRETEGSRCSKTTTFWSTQPRISVPWQTLLC